MSWELPDPPRDEDMVYLNDDLDGVDGRIARGLQRLEQHLAKWAEFVRRFPSPEERPADDAGRSASFPG